MIDANAPSLHAQFALDVQGLDALKRQAARDPAQGLEAAARQFEALFLQQMLKSMREAVPDGGLLGSQQTKFYEDMMDQQWAQTLAERGVGLADQLIAQLAKDL